MSLPGADVLVPQESKLSVSVECWRAILHEITRSSPKCVDIGGQCHVNSELAWTYCSNERAGDSITDP